VSAGAAPARGEAFAVAGAQPAAGTAPPRTPRKPRSLGKILAPFLVLVGVLLLWSLASRLLLDPDRRFRFGEPAGDPYAPDYDDSKWDLVSLPHSHEIFAANLAGFSEQGRSIGWYRREIQIPREWLKKRVFLEFQGAMQATALWVNGKKIGEYAISGYDSFNFDITPYIQQGTNLIAVRVEIAHHVANDLGRFLERGAGVEPQKLHAVENAPMHRLQPVARVGERAVHDGGERIGEIALLERIAQVDVDRDRRRGRRRRNGFGHGLRVTPPSESRQGRAYVFSPPPATRNIPRTNEFIVRRVWR